MDLIAQSAPALDWPGDAETLAAFDGAVERHPGHDLGVRELPRPTAHFPQSLVGRAPDCLQMLDQLQLQVPFGAHRRQAALTALKQRIHDLAENVDLQLLGRSIADAHRLCALITGEVGELPLIETPFAGETVHDLYLRRIAGHRTLQPTSPRLGLLLKAAV